MRNGKGKEYEYIFNANDELIQMKFECEYLNKQRNGLGKKINCDNGIVLFECNYKYGRKEGKAKEYYPNGKLKREGEYFDDRRTGNWKEYYDNGKLKFEGKFVMGKYNAVGKEYNEFGDLIHEGEYKMENERFI